VSAELVWFRRDLRLADNPALQAALAGAEQVVPVFCIDDRLIHGRHSSGARVQFMLESLADLDRELQAKGSSLLIRHGDPAQELTALARQVGADTIHACVDAGPFARRRDQQLQRSLMQAGIELRGHPGIFVVDDLDAVRTGQGDPYTVFTPFYRSWLKAPRRPVWDAPTAIPALPDQLRATVPGSTPGSTPALPTLAALGLSSRARSPAHGGTQAAVSAVTAFLETLVAGYDSGRNDLGDERASRLSPYLHFGCISPRALESALPEGDGAEAFRRQLCWRDFYAHVLRSFPANATSEHQPRYRGTLSWNRDEQLFRAWCQGETGYPLVDAAMRQLLEEGWMHNRARLVAGSFLTKDLGIDWRWGERYFMELLIDGDEASNSGNWQWIASVGVDPQPVTRRIFNPTLQQQRFDPDGRYVRRYVPELRQVPDGHLAEPWTMPSELQQGVGCVIGRDYPAPVVDHAAARRQTIERYQHAAVTAAAPADPRAELSGG
jgi:deoxyribodipyrimidine photo-lyase